MYWIIRTRATNTRRHDFVVKILFGSFSMFHPAFCNCQEFLLKFQNTKSSLIDRKVHTGIKVENVALTWLVPRRLREKREREEWREGGRRGESFIGLNVEYASSNNVVQFDSYGKTIHDYLTSNTYHSLHSLLWKPNSIIRLNFILLSFLSTQ